jgi:hypothetical protein
MRTADTNKVGRIPRELYLNLGLGFGPKAKQHSSGWS